MTRRVIDGRRGVGEGDGVDDTTHPPEDPVTEHPAYAVAYLTDIRFGEEIADYLRRINATLAPYGGRFLVHGARPHALEGEWPGDVVVLQFPDRQAALDWYASPAYQDILPLRTRNTRSIAAVVDGVEPGYTAAAGLERLLAARG